MKAFVITILTILLVSNLGYCQEFPVDTFNNTAYKEYQEPQFKGKDFSREIYNYFFSGNAFYLGTSSRYLPNPETTYYEMTIKYRFGVDGSLKEAVVVKSSGFKNLDNEVIRLSKNFARKKYMTPAFSEEGAVECEITVPLLCKYFVLKSPNSKITRNLPNYW